MENVKWTVRMLAAYMKESIEDMAEKAGIDRSHLKSVSAGRATMTADDLQKLAKYTGIDPFAIQP